MTERVSDKFVKIVNEIKHTDQPSATRNRVLLDAGADSDLTKYLKKMKNGVLTTVTMAFSGANSNTEEDVLVNFRVISAQEEADIYEEMNNLKYTPMTPLYNIYYLSKILSKATKSIPSLLELAQPEISEDIFRRCIPTSSLFFVGNKYLEFLKKYSPKLESLTEEEVNDVLEQLNNISNNDDNEVTSQIKKLDLLTKLSCSQMLEIILVLQKRLLTIGKQMDKLSTGL